MTAEHAVLPVNPWVVLRDRAGERPDAPAVSDPDRSLTYRGLLEEVETAAAHLERRGLRRGDVVSVLMDNVVSSVVWTWAASRLGLTAVLLNPRLREADLQFALSDSGSVALVGEGSLDRAGLLETARAWVEDPTVLLTAILPETVVGRERPGTPWAEPRPDDVAWVLYTSGTTSHPKGVALSHLNLANSRKIAGGLSGDEITFMAYPLSAITGCHNGVLASFLVGGSVVLDGAMPVPEDVVTRLERGDITHLACHRLYLKKIGPALTGHEVRIDKASVFPRLVSDRALYEAIGAPGLVVGYGMTETTGPVTYGCGYTLDHALADSCDGHPVAAEVEVRDSTTGSRLPAGEVGELWVRGPQLSVGYWSADGRLTPLADDDGWLRTGDVGRIGDAGCVHYVQRASDSFKSRGFTVSPGEVEELVRQVPWVHDCVVVGLPTEDDTLVVALVEKEPGATVTDVETAALLAGCKERLASFKVPRAVHVVDEMPRTRTGKPHRPAVMELLTAHYVGSPV